MLSKFGISMACQELELALISSLLFFWFSSPVAWAKETDKQNLEVDLMQAVSRFSKNHRMSSKQAQNMLFDLTNRSYCLAKGGVAPVSEDITIFLREARNSAEIAHIRWQGKSRDSFETLITDGKRILHSEKEIRLDSICIIVFTPTEVSFIDYRAKAAGAFRRNLPFHRQRTVFLNTK